MNKPVTHIIHRLNLELQAGTERAGREAYRRAGKLLQQYVLPKLEELLQQYDRDDLHIRLDKLDVQVDASGRFSLEETLKELLPASVVQQLAVALADEEGKPELADEGMQRSSKAEHIAEAFVWFLVHGRLPWWFGDGAKLADTNSLIATIAEVEDSFLAQLRTALNGHTMVIERLILQCDARLMAYLFSVVAPLHVFKVASALTQRLPEFVGKPMPAHEAERRYWQIVWQLWHKAPATDGGAAAFVRQLDRLVFLTLQGEMATPYNRHAQVEAISQKEEQSKPIDIVDDPGAQDKPNDRPKETGDLFVNNAGLILLHPFLQFFFAELGLLAGAHFRDDSAAGLAAHLLHYLATGREQAADFDLAFEKYLCGLRPEAITDRFARLTPAMKTEADGLLRAAIGHWTVLKNTSADGLREGFLQRKGKLQYRAIEEASSQYPNTIIMETATLDILLQQLPWNISLVKLPWLPVLIHVEWSQ